MPTNLPEIRGFEHLVDERVRAFLQYWLSLRGGRRLPSRRDLDPVDIPWALPLLWLCEVAGPNSYRYRLAGETINEVYGRSLAGLYLVDLIRPEGYALVSSRYDAAVEGPAVVHSIGRIYARSDRHYRGERLILPLSDDGDRVHHLIGITVRDRGLPDDGRPYLPEDVTTTVTPLP